MPLFVIPVAYYVVGTAVATGVTVAAWLSSDDWGVDEYRDNMSKTHATILAWHDQLKKTGCWNKLKPELRSQWQNYMTRFGAHWKKGVPSLFVSDDEERTARALIAELPEWAKRFEACGVGEAKDTPFLSRFSQDDMIKIGVGVVVAAFAYRLIKGKPLLQLGEGEEDPRYRCVKFAYKMVRGERKLVCVQWAVERG
jgi:hypothetical protein